VLDHQQQGLDGGLPVLELVLGLRQHLDIPGGVPEGDKLSAARQRNRIAEFSLPAWISHRYA